MAGPEGGSCELEQLTDMFPFGYGYTPRCPHGYVPTPLCHHDRHYPTPPGPIGYVHFYRDWFHSGLPGLPSGHTMSITMQARVAPGPGTWVMVSDAQVDDNGTWTIGLMWPSQPIVLVGNMWDQTRVPNPVCCRARLDCSIPESPSETPDGSPTWRPQAPMWHPPPPPPPTEPPPEGVQSPNELSTSGLPEDGLIL